MPFRPNLHFGVFLSLLGKYSQHTLSPADKANKYLANVYTKISCEQNSYTLIHRLYNKQEEEFSNSYHYVFSFYIRCSNNLLFIFVHCFLKELLEHNTWIASILLFSNTVLYLLFKHLLMISLLYSHMIGHTKLYNLFMDNSNSLNFLPLYFLYNILSIFFIFRWRLGSEKMSPKSWDYFLILY